MGRTSTHLRLLDATFTRSVVKKVLTEFLIAWLCIVLAISTVCASIIYVVDDQGDVVKYDTATDSVSAVGNLGGFTVGRVMGLAYDPDSQSLLILDRNGYTIYAMDPETGSASTLFTTFIGPNPEPWEVREFEGGAVRNGLLYGFDEITQTVAAYSIETGVDQELSGSFATEHSHAVGVDHATGQLYSLGGSGTFREVNDDGTIGPIVVTAATGNFYYDVDYLDGGFVGTMFARGIDFIDSSGNVTVWLTGEELAAEGLETCTGIVVEPSPTSSAAPMGPSISLRAYPNPMRSDVQVVFHGDAHTASSSQNGHFRAAVYDATGRLVRRLQLNESDVGRHLSLSWDGRDQYGRPVAHGIFFVRVRLGGSIERSVKIVRLEE